LETRRLLSAAITRAFVDPNTLASDIGVGRGHDLHPRDAPPPPPPGLPLLNSRPSAPTAIYLDFDGDAPTGILGYSDDGNPLDFTAAEAALVTQAWQDVSRYFAPFDVNVTTAYPSVPFAWEVIGNNIAGNYSNVNVFPNSSPQSFCESNAVRTGRMSVLAHELGHNFGLMHQSDFDHWGNKVNEYSAGPDPLHGPLMGIDFAGTVHKWFNGHPTTSPLEVQPDVEVIASKIAPYQGSSGDGFAPDDFGNTIAAATTMTVSGAGLQTASGNIERLDDSDAFRFTANGGPLNIDATPVGVSGVDLKLEIYKPDGTLVAASDSQTNNDQHLVIALASGTFYALVKSHGNYADLGQYNLIVTSGLPIGWSTQDIGPSFSGTGAGFDGSLFTVRGSGTDIWNTSDEFRFVYTPLAGNGSITARVVSLQNTNQFAKAGVMIREALSGPSTHAMLELTPGAGMEFIRRTTIGGQPVNSGVAGLTVPYWVRLTRNGTTFTAERSTNGTTWNSVGSATITMANNVFIGLCVCSHNSGVVATGTFDNVSLTGTTGPPPPVYNGLPAPGNVAAAPAAGTETTINVTWSDISGETGYSVERSSDGVNFTQAGTSPANATSFPDVNLTGGYRYFYRVIALNGSGGSIPSSAVSAVNRPGVLTNLSYMSPTTTDIVLDWGSADGETGFHLERSTDNVQFTSLGNVIVNTSSYTDSGLAPGTIYYYHVTPLSGAGDGGTATRQSSTRLDAVTGMQFTKVAPNQIQFHWDDLPNETQYLVQRSPDFGEPQYQTIATLGPNVTSYTDNTVTPLNEYYYRVLGTNGVSQSIVPVPLIAATPQSPSTLPLGWNSLDIFTVGGPGASGFASNTFTSIASGSQIDRDLDEFRFTYREMSGNGEIIARVASLEYSDVNSQAGVMFRQTLLPGAREIYVTTTPINGTLMAARSTFGGFANVFASNSFAAPTWVRLVRVGDTFTGYQSADGSTWNLMGEISVQMPPAIYVGLAVLSHNNSRLTKATFTNVSGSALTQTDTSAPFEPFFSRIDNDTGISSSDQITSDNTLVISGTVEAGTFVTLTRIGSGVIGTTQADFLGNWVFDYSDTALADGTYQFTATARDASNNTSPTSSPLVVAVDRTAPTVSNSSFNYLTNQSVKVSFSEDIFSPGSPATMTLSNLTTSQSFMTQMQFDSVSHTATFTRFGGGVLPDGDYRAMLPAGTVTDIAGNLLASPLNLDFFTLGGDADHDRDVDVNDLGILATNWQQSPRTFAQGDFDYNGTVDVNDLGILASHWQQTLPTPSAPFTASSAPMTPRKLMRLVEMML
jgi:regulation of enolase protein 1 (concanavalin A-like superfamily)